MRMGSRNMGKQIRFLTMTALIFCLGACKSTKTVTGGEADARMSAKNIIDNHYTNQTKFKTLSGRIKIDYVNGDESQGVNVSLRMEKDKVIWMSAPLGMVKAYITPNKVSFYNKLQNEYFDGDFSYLSHVLGTELDFEKVQNLLLGNAVFDLRKEKFVSSVAEGNYQLKPKKARDLFKILFQVEPRNFKIATQQVSQPDSLRQFEAKYTYQNVSGNVLPEEIKILAEDKGELTNINLSFRNLELNKSMSFPYKVPKGFDKITLK